LFSGKKRIPIGVEICQVFEDMVVVTNVNADSNEATVDIQSAAIRFQNLNFDTLIAFGTDNDLGSLKLSSIGENREIRSIRKYGHSKHDSFQ
jgi:hypothetical protein